MLTDLASSKRTATSKAVNPQKCKEWLSPHAHQAGWVKNAGVKESQTQLRGKNSSSNKHKTQKGAQNKKLGNQLREAQWPELLVCLFYIGGHR